MIGSKLLPLAPRSRIANSSASANSRSVDAVGEPRQQRLERVVGDRARGADAIDLAGVLHPAQLLDQRARGHELDAGERVGELALLRPGDAVVLEAEPRARSRPRARAASRCAGAGERRSRSGRVDARGVELLLRLLACSGRR